MSSKQCETLSAATFTINCHIHYKIQFANNGNMNIKEYSNSKSHEAHIKISQKIPYGVIKMNPLPRNVLSFKHH